MQCSSPSGRAVSRYIEKALSTRHLQYIKTDFSLRCPPFMTCLRDSTKVLTVIPTWYLQQIRNVNLGRSEYQSGKLVIHCSLLNLCVVSFSLLTQCVISKGLFFLPDSPFIMDRAYREGLV